MSRAQSHVVGVALMLGISVLALGALTVGVGEVIDAQTAHADATRIADEMDTALQPIERTGPHTDTVQFADGSLRTVERDLRVYRNDTLVAERSVGALVFSAGERRVAFVAGAIVRGENGGAWLATEPPITASERNEVLVVGAPVLSAGDTAVSGSGGSTVHLQTNVSHDRRDLGPGRYEVAIETTAHGAFEEYFAGQNASTASRDIDGDGIESMVATYDGTRRGYLVTHNLSLEVAHG
ncbi:MAG: type IV pilin [Haloarculaceae archaeon]